MSIISTEHFTEALSLVHMMHEGHVPQQERIAAEQYLMALRNSPEGLNLAFHIVSNEEFNDIRSFWAFNTIITHLPDLAPSIDGQQATQIYHCLTSWLMRQCQSTTLPDFILNKHAQTLVVGIQEFYPARWPQVFEDVFGLLLRRDGWPQVRDSLTLYFLRVFEYIDERVVCVRSQTDRTKEQRQRDMEVKDAMREWVIAHAVSAWYQVLCEYRVKTPEVARVCLDVVQAYVEWIDITLVVTPEWMTLLYFFTTVPHLRQGGCDCLFNMVEKKQLPAVKTDTLRAMGIVEALPRIVLMVSTPSTEEEETFLLGVVSLATGLAAQLLVCTESSIPGAVDMIHLVIPEVLKLFSIAHYQVRDVVLPFVQQYVKSSVMGDNEATELLHLLYRHTILGPYDWDEPRDEVIDQRKVIHNMIRLLYRKFPQMVLDHCSRVVYQVVSVANPSELPNCEAEGAIRYLYELGESIKMDVVLKDPSNPVTLMVYHLLHCPSLTQHNDSLVHQAYFELLDRYWLFFVHYRDEVPMILNQMLLMPCGIVNSHAKVRSRVCYLFGHLLQTLKMQFAPHAENIVRAMKEVFEVANVAASDKLDLYEGMGTMLSVSEPAMCLAVADTVVRHMQSQASLVSGDATPQQEALAALVADDIAFLSHLAKGVAGTEATKIPDSPPLASSGSKQDVTFPNVLPQQASNNARGVSPDGDMQQPAGPSPPLQVFWQVTSDVMAALDTWYGSAIVRDRACLFMHQMVNILSHSALGEVFEQFVLKMTRWSSCASDLPKICRVVYQFVNRTRGASIATVSRLIPVIHHRVAQCCCPVSGVQSEHGVVSEYVKEQADVYRSYFSVLHAVAHCSCLPALFHEPTLSLLGDILSQLVAAIGVSAEFELPKQALQILSRLAFQSAQQSSSDAATAANSIDFACDAFMSFIVETAIPTILDTFTSKVFDTRDAKNFFLVSEFCQLLKSVMQKIATDDGGRHRFYESMTTHAKFMCLTHEEATGICLRLQQEPRATTQFKNSFRQQLEACQARRWNTS